MHMAVWAVFFVAMTVSGRTDGKHTGDSLPFWEQSCRENRSNACARLLKLEATYCGNNSAWACNELGTHYAAGAITAKDTKLASVYFSKACELRFPAGCANLLQPDALVHGDPHELDLRLLLREGGQNLLTMPKHELYLRACKHGFSFACRASDAT